LKKSIKTILSQPYPFYYQGKELWLLTFILCIMTLLFGYLFEPFEVYRPEHKIGYFWITLIHSFTPGLVILSFFLLKTPPTQKEDWTIKKEFLLIALFLLVTGFFQFIIRDLIYDNPNNWSFRYLYEELRNTFLVGILFAFILIPMNYNRLVNRNRRNARTFTSSNLDANCTEKTAHYCSELNLNLEDIVYVKAEGNYVEIFLKNGNKSLKRLTMKSLESILQTHTNFIKTHRSYLVNMDQIASISGNAQGYKLQLKSYSSIVPVSRKMISVFDEIMNSN